MPVSPADFALWASATGNKYPQNPAERAQLTPEVYDFVRNIPKRGLQGAPRVTVERVIYDQPASVRHEDDNSVLASPITPDNHVPKVAGTVGNTMTADHYEAQQLENEQDKREPGSFARTAAKVALAAGLVAGGVAAARSPVVRSRVTDFLSQFGTSREPVVDTVAATGDITPQPTARNFNQHEVDSQTQVRQAARGAEPGTALKDIDTTTTEVGERKPVTQSEVISTSQHFSPSGSLATDPWTGQKTTPTVSERTSDFLTEFGQAGAQDPWATRQGTPYTPIFSVSPEYKQQYPPKSSLEDTGGFVGQVTAGTSPGRFVLHEEVPRPALGGKSIVRTIGEGPISENVSIEVPLSPYPEQRDVTGARLGGPARLAGASDIEAAISTYAGQGVFPSGEYSSLATGSQYAPVSPNVTDALLKGPVRVAGASDIEAAIGTYAAQGVFPSGKYSSLLTGSQYAPVSPNVTGARLGGPVRLAGARDIEAAISTYAGQGVFPSGEYSSLATGSQYAPVSPEDRPVSPVETKIIGGTEQSVLDKVRGYLGGKAAWMEQSAASREAERQERVGRALQSIDTLKQQTAAMPDESTRKKAETFVKQAINLYDITQDPTVLETATQQAMPLTVTFPGGQTVETRQFFKPFGTTGGKPSTDPQYAMQRGVTSVVDALEQNVRNKQETYNNVKINILRQFGLQPTDKITNNMFNQLPNHQRQLLLTSAEKLKEATSRYNIEKDFQVLYSIPEQIASVKEVPIISQQSGEVIGATVVPEERGIHTPELHRILAAGGAGRQETGGVGRRREALESDPGGSEMVFSTGPTGLSMSELESTPFLYRDVETGEILNPNAVPEDMVKSGAVKAIRGTSVEPQRVMGQEGRTFKGVSSAEIDPRSFDETQRQMLAQQYPERVTPEGLIYSERAMGNKETRKIARQVAAARKGGQRVQSKINPNVTIPASVQINKPVSESGADPALGTRFSKRTAPAPGSPEAANLEVLKQRAEMVRRIMRGEQI